MYGCFLRCIEMSRVDVMDDYDTGLPVNRPLASGTDSAASIEVRDRTSVGRRNDRQSRVLLPFWTNGQSRKQLKHLAVEEDSTQQNLLTEALNMLFRSRSKPPIA
jgi:hypothetical protein